MTQENYNLDLKIASLPQTKDPVYIMTDGPFTYSKIFFYHNGKFYEGNYSKVQEHIKSRGAGEPIEEEVKLAVERLHASHKGIIFSPVVTTHYGNWVIQGIKINKKKEYDKELIQMSIDTRVELGHLGTFNSLYPHSPISHR
jgi:hypothetical protein